MPLLDPEQMEALNAAVDAAFDAIEDGEVPGTAEDVERVLEETADDVVAQIEALNEIADGRGEDVPEWAVPTASSLERTHESSMREGVASSLSPWRIASMATMASRMLEPLPDVEPPAAESAVLSRLRDTLEARVTQVVMPRGNAVWKRVSDSLAEDYRKGKGVDEAARNVRTMLRGTPVDSDRGRELASKIATETRRAERLARRGDVEGASRARSRASAARGELDGWATSESRWIARTEMNAAANGTAVAVVREEGFATHKEWLATGDDRVRETHADLDATRIPIDRKFSNGLDYPGDPAGGQDETINCRCSVIFHVEDPPAGATGGDSVGASAIRAVLGPPQSFFDAPDLTDLSDGQGITIGERDEEGFRPIHGRAWLWDQCLLHGQPLSACQTPREFAEGDDYSFFHSRTGFELEDADPLAVGHLIMGHTEAETAAAARNVFDDPRNTVAAIRVVEDEWGGVFAGSVLPHVSDADVALMRASQVSGEWWKLRPEGDFHLAGLSVVARGALPPVEDALAQLASARGAADVIVSSSCAPCAIAADAGDTVIEGDEDGTIRRVTEDGLSSEDLREIAEDLKEHADVVEDVMEADREDEDEDAGDESAAADDQPPEDSELVEKVRARRKERVMSAVRQRRVTKILTPRVRDRG